MEFDVSVIRSADNASESHVQTGAVFTVVLHAFSLLASGVNKGKGSWICIAPHCEKLVSEALRYGSTLKGFAESSVDCDQIAKKMPGSYAIARYNIQ